MDDYCLCGLHLKFDDIFISGRIRPVDNIYNFNNHNYLKHFIPFRDDVVWFYFLRFNVACV